MKRMIEKKKEKYIIFDSKKLNYNFMQKERLIEMLLVPYKCQDLHPNEFSIWPCSYLKNFL